MNSTGTPLELSDSQLETLVQAALDRLMPWLRGIGERRCIDASEASVQAARQALAEPLPEAGSAIDEVLDTLMACAEPGFHTAGPGYLGFIPGGGLPHTAVADLMAGILNRFVGINAAAPGLVAMESRVVRWLCDLVGYPSTSLGFLTTGGSMANFAALVTARRVKLGDDLSGGTLYVTDQTHHSMAKAAMLAGFPPDAVRSIPVDASLRMDLSALAGAIASDRAAGRSPFFVCANAGTTNTGVVDPLEAVATLAAEHGLWLHADGAYGGAFLLTERGRTALAGIDAADSVTLDPHKGLFLPYGTGALVVRRGEHLERTFGGGASYLTILSDDDEEVDLCRISPELSRPFRGARVWLPMKLAGAAAFRAALDEKLDLAREAAQHIAALPDTTLLAPPTLSLFAFRWHPPGLTDTEADALNQQLMDEVAAKGRVFLSGTTVRGRFYCRMCILSFRTHTEHVEAALTDLKTAARTLSKSRENSL